jgi:histidine triad (HIT) family protein
VTYHPGTCIFCEIIARRAPARIVAESPTAIAFLPLRLINAGHTLVVPKHHTENFFEMTHLDLTYVMSLMKDLTDRMMELWRPQGLNILQNNGKCADQTVFHSHFHVIPRWSYDAASENEWGTREIRTTEKQLEEQYQQLRMPSVTAEILVA